jgi:Polyketide cyclase / dehydrase and lipid transport
MLRCERRTSAPADVVWALIARPGEWSRWAPHLRGAVGLGAPEVTLGARGSARLLGVVGVPARITAKRRGSLWSWRVGPVTVRHRVSAVAGGTLVAMELDAPAPLEPALRLTYGPVVALLLRNLVRVAEQEWRAGIRPPKAVGTAR